MDKKTSHPVHNSQGKISSLKKLLADWTASVAIDICLSTTFQSCSVFGCLASTAFLYMANASRIPVNVDPE
jgi:hypothetical protein